MGHDPIAVEISDGFRDSMGAKIIHEYYADRPLNLIPLPIIRSLLKKWSGRNDVFFLVAKVEGAFAGFAFAQAIGPQPWRVLLRVSALSTLYGLLIWMLGRLSLRFPRRLRGSRQQVCNPAFPNIDSAPLACRTNDIGKMAVGLEFIYVHPSFRGRNVAGQLLNRLSNHVATLGFSLALAHIAPFNEPSIRAFQRAEWRLYSSSSGSLYACLPLKEAPKSRRAEPSDS